MSKWKTVQFSEIIIDETKNAKKLKKSSYELEGKYPIIDQGMDQVAGYTNLDEGLYENIPAIIFGDHTRIIKYVDKPFFLGADGTKVLNVRDKGLHHKYLYYVLKKKKVKDTGYNRHYKWLKEIEIPIPPLETQIKIANELDTITNLIEKRKQQLEKLDLLVKAKFIEMFGDPVENPMGWKECTLGKVLNIITDFNANGGYEYLDTNVTMYDEPNYALMVRTTDLESGDLENRVKYIDKNAYNILAKSKVFEKDIIMNKIGSAGSVYLMPKMNIPVSLGRNAFLMRFDTSINHVFIYYLLTTAFGKMEIEKRVRGAVTKTITKDAVRSINIVLPPIELQNEFEEYVTINKRVKNSFIEVLDQLETLYKSKMQEYFG